MGSYKRESASAKREIRRTIGVGSAADALGLITPGCEIFCVTKGDFSLVDAIVHCLDATGPADVTISTWTAANAELGFAHRLLSDGKIASLRFIVDFSFPVRQPAYCAALRERFGDESVRLTKNHAKFVLIRNAAWSLVIRTSMNLNENRRMESIEISDCPKMAEHLGDLCAAMFAEYAPGKQFDQRPYENTVDFERFLAPHIDQATAETAALQGDRGRYFGAGVYATDVRRAGWSSAKTGRGLD